MTTRHLVVDASSSSAMTLGWLGQANAVGISRRVGRIKGLPARWINVHWHTIGIAAWQRGFHDRVLHNADEWARARRYVANNSMVWRR